MHHPLLPAKVGAEQPWPSSMEDLREPFGEWQLGPDILYLDHGAFGACPAAVSKRQEEVRRRIERNPHDFYERAYVSECQASREALAGFVDADPADLVLLPGATHGMNVVIQSLRFSPGDEILTTNHAYSSVCLALDRATRRDGSRVVVVDIPLEVAGPDVLVQRILACVTPRTRFAVIDHVPSRSAIVFPIREIVRELAQRGVDTLVDGAHAPGMIPLSLTSINAAYYVANCHKWMCNPRGVGFLHVRRDRAQTMAPLVVGRSPYVVERDKHSKLQHDFGWMGTHCPSALLCLPSSIKQLQTVMPGGLQHLMGRNHSLAVLARRLVCAVLGVPVPCPDDMIGTMATIPLPDSPGPETEGMLPIQKALWHKHGICIPVYSWPAYPRRVIRLSVQAYNTLDQYFRLAGCLRAVLDEEGRATALSALDWARPPHQEPEDVVEASKESSVCGHMKVDDWSDMAAACGEAPRQDISTPDPKLLLCLAFERVRSVLSGSFGPHTVALYPTRGHTAGETDDSGQANSEFSRVVHILSNARRRRIPRVMASLIAEALEAEDVIDHWPQCIGALRIQAQMLVRTMVADMEAPWTPTACPRDAGSFVSRVVPYEAEDEEDNLSLRFWRRALGDFAAQPWSPARVSAFVELHAFVKDPVGGLRGGARAAQAAHFHLLWAPLRVAHREAGGGDGDGRLAAAAAQLAAESSFLAQPLVRRAVHVHFAHNQQLVYAYADLAGLARSEFATPRVVLAMIRDVLRAPPDCEHVLAPIAVARIHPVASSDDARDVIIDGNNRATTVAFLQYVATHGLPAAGDTDGLRRHCGDQGLGPIFFADFCAVLELLWHDAADVAEQLRQSACLAPFRRARQLPVLVCEESSFLTQSLAEARQDVLQPIHQSIFATDDLLVALPAKMQSHGRADGFKALPLR